MSKVAEILAGMGLLIGLFLVLSRGRETVSIVEAIAGNTIQGVKVLQGRG